MMRSRLTFGSLTGQLHVGMWNVLSGADRLQDYLIMRMCIISTQLTRVKLESTIAIRGRFCDCYDDAYACTYVASAAHDACASTRHFIII